MNFHAGASLVIAISSFSLCLFIYIMGRRKLPNITLSLLLFVGAVWSFGQFMAEFAATPEMAFLWVRIHQSAAVVLPVFFFQFVLAFLGRLKERRLLLFLTYVYLLIFFPLSFTTLYIKDISPNFFSNAYPVPGSVFPIYTVLYFMFIAYSFYELFMALKTATGDSRNQIIYIILASFVSMIGGSIVFLPIYSLKVLPVTYYSIPLFAVLALYAMIRYRLLDIKIVIRRGLVYFLLTLLFSAIYILVVFGMREIFRTVIGLDSVVASILVVFAFTVFFVPLRDRIQDGVDRIFFKGAYDYQKILKNLSRSVTSILDLDKLLGTTIDTISFTMKTKWASVMLKNGEKFDVEGWSGSGGPKTLEEGSKLVGSLKNKRDAININDIGAENIKEELRARDIYLSIPMMSKSKLIGILNLGEKISGEPFSGEDVDLLTTLTNQIAVATENAKLHEEVLKRERELFRADKLASLGTIAAGMAHEIKNPLASIKGMTQILHENLGDREFVGKFTDIIPRQIERISRIVENLLRFGKPEELQKSTCNLNLIIDEAIKLVELECRKKAIKIKKSFAELPSLMLDQSQTNQAILNIILNSIESMPDGGYLSISTRIIGKEISIEICDTGCGIPKENIKNIFDPFYSTKSLGTGMGLAVTYSIIEEHGGRIEVESEAGKGTKFKIFLPIK